MSYKDEQSLFVAVPLEEQVKDFCQGTLLKQITFSILEIWCHDTCSTADTLNLNTFTSCI